MSTAITVPPAVSKFLAGTQAQWGTKATLSSEDGITVSKDATEEDIKGLVRKVFAYKQQMDQYRTILDRFLGQLICEYAARTGKTWAESISDLNLAGEHGITGLGWRVVEKLPRMVSRNLPESFALPGLKTGHFDAVSSFSGPDDPGKQAEWSDRCHQILVQAAEKPNERGRSWVEQNMRELQKEFGIAPKRPEAVSRLLPKAVGVADILLSWSQNDFDSHGIERSKVVDYWEAMRADLVERKVIPDGSDPAGFVPPWVENVKPPTTIENEEPKKDDGRPDDPEAPTAGEDEEESEARKAAEHDSSEAEALDGGDGEVDGDQQDPHP
jgi:hypothetical protein